MPDATRRAFQVHADQHLGDRVPQAIAEIERVYQRDPQAVVSVSGGKDSLTTLALAEQADCEHRALHFDWGPRFIPRPVARALVATIREHVPDRRLFVASHQHAQFERFPNADRFRAGLQADPGGETYAGVDSLAGALAHADGVGCQILGVRRGESGSRDRSIDGLYGESLGRPAAYPLREWSARDVWAFIVDRGLDYPEHYDRVAATTGDGGPRAYERARLATFHDPEFEAIGGAAMGHAEWDNRQIDSN